MKKTFKSYCWNCEKETEMLNPEKSKSNKNLIIGICKVCGVQIYKKLN